MWNRIISYMLFPFQTILNRFFSSFQLLKSYAKPGLQWWNDDADDDTGEWGGICVFWAGPCVTQPNSASSPPHNLLLLLLLLLHIFSSSSSLWDRILLRRTAPTTRTDTQLDVERRSLLLSRLLSLPTAAAAHAGCSSIKLSVHFETSSM